MKFEALTKPRWQADSSSSLPELILFLDGETWFMLWTRHIDNPQYSNMFFQRADVEYIQDTPWFSSTYCSVHEYGVMESGHSYSNFFNGYEPHGNS